MHAHHHDDEPGVEGRQGRRAPGVGQVVRELRVGGARDEVFLGGVAGRVGALGNRPRYPLLEGGDAVVVVVGHDQADIFEAGPHGAEGVGDKLARVAAVVLGARQALLLAGEEAGAVPTMGAGGGGGLSLLHT